MWSLYKTFNKTHKQGISDQKTWVASTDRLQYEPQGESNLILRGRGPKSTQHSFNTAAENELQRSESFQKPNFSADSSPSLVSSENSRESEGHVNVKQLFHTLHDISETRQNIDPKMSDIYNQTIDTWCRQHLESHKTLQSSYIDRHFKMHYPNGVVRPSNDSRTDFLHLVIKDPLFTTQGLVHGLDPVEQLEILKAHEKYLLLQRWRNLWEELRPPRSKWYAMKTAGFAVESRKAHDLLISKKRQQLQFKAKEMLLDLQRTVQLDSEF